MLFLDRICLFFSDNSIPLILRRLGAKHPNDHMCARMCVPMCVGVGRWLVLQRKDLCLFHFPIWHKHAKNTYPLCAPHVRTHTQSHPAHEILPFQCIHWHFFCPSSHLSFFFCSASIVTVIRLVNDAVDNIESEGMKCYLLLSFLLCAFLLCLQRAVALWYKVLMAAQLLLSSLLRIRHPTWVSNFFVRFQHWICPCFNFSPLVSVLFVSVPLSDIHLLSPFVVSNMDKEQRRSSPGEWAAKQLKNILLTCHPSSFISQAVIPKPCLLCSFYFLPEYLSDSIQHRFRFLPLFSIHIYLQTLNVNADTPVWVVHDF